MIEREMDAGVLVSRNQAEATSSACVLELYAKEVTSKKHSSASELSRIQAMQRHPLALGLLASIRVPTWPATLCPLVLPPEFNS